MKLRYDSQLTSVLKTVSWRFIATATTFSLAWIFTGELETALKIGGVEFFAKMLFYYLHERVWTLILHKQQKDRPNKAE